MKSSEEYLSSRLIVYFMPSSRQLAAIMFTDIVGYTTLMGSDWLIPWFSTDARMDDLLKKVGL